MSRGYFDNQPYREFWERGGAASASSWSAGLAPHNDTLRWTVTVPAGQSAVVDLLALAAQRATAPTVVGQARCYLTIIDPQTSTWNLIAQIYTEEVGDLDRFVIPVHLFFGPGTVINAYTADYSTGGSVYFTMAYHAILFPTAALPTLTPAAHSSGG